VIVLDTTVLIYAVGADHRLRQPSRVLVELVRDGSGAGGAGEGAGQAGLATGRCSNSAASSSRRS
jgi:hypothetical protein